MSETLLEVRGVRRGFDGGQVAALRGVSFTVCAGEFISIAGPSGCGKTTLLQLLGALDHPDEGEIAFRGQPLRHLRNPGAFRARHIGFIFQSFHLLPTLTALENVQMPMFEMPWPASERRRRAETLLKDVGMDHRLHHVPPKLSGGERQRVAVARSLANGPDVLLADEPTGNLDSVNSARIMEMLTSLHTQRGMTLIMVTHDAEVAACAARTMLMRDGVIAADSAVS